LADHRLICTKCKMTEEEADLIYDLPYTRLPHPKYNGTGAIPAYEMIKFSVNIHRGCFGGCAFCTISAHQGKFINSRSEKSVLKEVEEVVKMPDFKGYLSDIGGPSANMYKMQGVDLKQCATCVRPSCIFPGICKNLNTNHDALTDLYRKVDSVPGIKKSFIGSGIRYDLFFDKDGEMPQDKREYATEVIANHVSGRLKVAPEHTADHVLKIMRKPSFTLFHKFSKFFTEINRRKGLNQELIPYFISSHPGSRSEDMAELAAETKELNFRLEQVQDFTPTPMTVATVIYHSGVHPYTMLPVEVARTKEEKLRQRSFFFWYMRENYTDLVAELNRTGRTDLITRIFGSKKNEAVKNKKEPVKGKKEVEIPEQEETYSFKKRKPGALKSKTFTSKSEKPGTNKDKPYKAKEERFGAKKIASVSAKSDKTGAKRSDSFTPKDDKFGTKKTESFKPKIDRAGAKKSDSFKPKEDRFGTKKADSFKPKTDKGSAKKSESFKGTERKTVKKNDSFSPKNDRAKGGK